MTNHDSESLCLWIELKPDFFAEVVAKAGVDGWNDCLEAMIVKGDLRLAWDTPQPRPVCISLDFRSMNCRGWQLDGVNLAVASTESATFQAASLRESTWGWTPHGDFRDSDLTDADFCLADISGCQFEGACLDGIKLDGAVHDPGNPPSGLESALLRRCRPLTVHGTGRGYPLQLVASCCFCLFIPFGQQVFQVFPGTVALEEHSVSVGFLVSLQLLLLPLDRLLE